MEKSPQSHDKFFKYLLSDLERTREYLRAYLPEDLTAALDMDTLQLENGSFIDDALRKSYSNLIFSVSIRSGKPANLCFLIEHKSHPDYTAAFQALHYRLLVSSLLIMKHYFEEGYLMQNAHFLLLGGYEEKGNFYPPLFVYFFGKIESKEEQVNKILDNLPPPIKSSFMNIFDIYKAKGEAEGLQP